MDNKLLKTKIDERTGLEYHLDEDYYIPNLVMPKQEKITLNEYERIRLKYLKEIQETVDNRVQQIIS